MTIALSNAAKSGKQGASSDLLLASILPYAYQQEIGPKFKARGQRWRAALAEPHGPEAAKRIDFAGAPS